MADTNVISGVEVGNSYSATGHTEHYNLPIYNATDKVSFLVDWNGAMREIDDLLYQVKSTGEVSEQQILALQTALETAQTTIQQITINIDKLTHDLGDVSADNTELHNRVDTLDTNYTELSSLIASMQTLVNNLSTKVDNLDASVNEIGDIAEQAQSDVASLTTRVASAETNISAVQSSVQSLNQEVDSVEGRVNSIGGISCLEMTTTHGTGTSEETISFSVTFPKAQIEDATGESIGNSCFLGVSLATNQPNVLLGSYDFLSGQNMTVSKLKDVEVVLTSTGSLIVNGNFVGVTASTANSIKVRGYFTKKTI